MIRFHAIKPILEDNPEFLANPDCEQLQMSVDYYKSIGFHPPWIGYYASMDGILVGSAGFKGKPVNNAVEIAYGTFVQFRSQGIGTKICKHLVSVALASDPDVIVRARTLREPNHSTKILIKNGFKLLGTVLDPDDGEVWEWEYVK